MDDVKNKTISEIYKQIEENDIKITEQNLKDIKALTYDKRIMEYVIKQNPEYIKYVHCNISREALEETLTHYKPTITDALNNQYLINDYYIEQIETLHCFTKYPKPIIEIKEALNNNPLKIRNIEIFKNKEQYINKIIYILTKLKQPETTTIEEQSTYYKYLKKIIEHITNIRYKKQKQNFEYSNIIEIHKKIKETLKQTLETNNIQLIENLAKEIESFVEKTISYDTLKEKLINFYNEYKTNKKLEIDTTKKFCNEILNHHRDNFLNNEKKNIRKKLKRQLNLTEKKQEQISKRKQLKIITKKIQNKEISYDELKKEFDIIKNSIKNNKDIKKKQITIPEETFNILEEIFIEKGTLNEQNISEILKTNDQEIIKYIINKYEKIKLKYINLSNINDYISEEEKEKLSLNVNNFYIINKEDTNYILIKLIYNLSEKQIDRLLENEEYFEQFKTIIPLINIIEELNQENILKIFTNYKKIISYYSLENQNNPQLIIEKLEEIMYSAIGLEKIDKQYIKILKEQTLKAIGESKLTDYLDFYVKMLKKTYGYIPPIDLKYGDISLQSGDYFNEDRLIIGKIAKDSCIDLNNVAGGRTYKECLLDPTGDVIIIRKNDIPIDRILIFRRGNTIQMMTQYHHEYPIELYKEIAQQIVIQNDYKDIEYILVNKNAVKEKDIETIKDDRILSFFPHTDIIDEAVLLNKKEDQPNFKFIEMPLQTYKKIRKPINYKPTIKDIERITALYNFIYKKNVIINPEDTEIICGEDWLKTNNETIVLNPQDEEAINEINNINKKTKS